MNSKPLFRLRSTLIIKKLGPIIVLAYLYSLKFNLPSYLNRLASKLSSQAFNTRLIILPERVLGNLSLNSISLGAA